MMIFTGSGLVTPRDVFCRLYIPLQSPVAPLHMHVPHANFPGAFLHVEKLTSEKLKLETHKLIWSNIEKSGGFLP